MWHFSAYGCCLSHSLQEFLEEKPINNTGEQNWEVLNAKNLNVVPSS